MSVTEQQQIEIKTIVHGITDDATMSTDWIIDLFQMTDDEANRFNFVVERQKCDHRIRQGLLYYMLYAIQERINDKNEQVKKVIIDMSDETMDFAEKLMNLF